MPTGQQYGTNVSQTFLTSAIGSGVTSFTVNSSTSWPTAPFTAVFGIGTSTQEAIDVGVVTGNTWSSVTRGIDGTSAQNQPLNQTITHADIGRDFREARSHIDSAGPVDASGEAVHGLTNTAGNVLMGTKETQTVTNKTLTAPVINAPVLGTTSTTPTGSALGFYSNNGVFSTVDASGRVASLQPPIDGPALSSGVAWTMDPVRGGLVTTPSSGSLSISMVFVNYKVSISNLYLSVQTGGSGLTAGQNLVGMYDGNGTRVGISADQTAAWGSTGNKTAALTMTGSLEPGTYWLAFLSVGTTPPKIYGGDNTIANIGIAVAPFRFSSLTGQTSLPSSITLSSFSSTGFIPFMMVS